jgi:hypothetical protein
VTDNFICFNRGDANGENDHHYIACLAAFRYGELVRGALLRRGFQSGGGKGRRVSGRIEPG